MTLHIVGSTGYIAKKLCENIPEGMQSICYARSPVSKERYLDVTRFSSNDCEPIQSGDVVILLAAVSSPDRCHTDYEEAYAVNVTGTERLIQECLRRDARVLFFSSDVVVGETNCACNETASVSPVGCYAQMKYRVERRFAEEPRVKVFRLSYVFSKEDKFMRFLEHCTASGELAQVYQALYRNVVYIQDVVEAAINLGQAFDAWKNPVFHVSGPEVLCRADLAELYRRIVDSRLQFESVVPEEPFFHARPNRIETSSLYLEKLLGRKPMNIAEAMEIEFQKQKES